MWIELLWKYFFVYNDLRPVNCYIDLQTIKPTNQPTNQPTNYRVEFHAARSRFRWSISVVECATSGYVPSHSTYWVCLCTWVTEPDDLSHRWFCFGNFTLNVIGCIYEASILSSWFGWRPAISQSRFCNTNICFVLVYHNYCMCVHCKCSGWWHCVLVFNTLIRALDH